MEVGVPLHDKSRFAHRHGPGAGDGDYFGPALNRVARLQSAGHGQQTLLSRSIYELVRDHLPDDVELRDLGERRLKDLSVQNTSTNWSLQTFPGSFLLSRPSITARTTCHARPLLS